MQTSSPGWSAVEIRDEVDYERAWETVFGILARDFDIEYASKEDGYLRTAWLYSWSGIHQANYRVRVTVKYSPDRRALELKPEAQYCKGNVWLLGVDTRQISTLRTDVMGTVGRTTR